ncbi:MAG: hypothetical protein P8Z42_11610 [Anaerolineales bacterium]
MRVQIPSGTLPNNAQKWALLIPNPKPLAGYHLHTPIARII